MKILETHSTVQDISQDRKSDAAKKGHWYDCTSHIYIIETPTDKKVISLNVFDRILKAILGDKLYFSWGKLKNSRILTPSEFNPATQKTSGASQALSGSQSKNQQPQLLSDWTFEKIMQSDNIDKDVIFDRAKNWFKYEKKEKFDLMKKAADLGHTEAIEEIGDAYRNGEGVQQDVSLAIEYFKKAALKGNFFACQALANIYWNGEGGIAADKQEGKKWLYEALKFQSNVGLKTNGERKKLDLKQVQNLEE